MRSQNELWDEKHQTSAVARVGEPSVYATEVAHIIPSHCHILEVGCGAGRDAVFFANRGHKVMAIDFSSVAIEKNRARYVDTPNLSFEIVDIAHTLPFITESFEVVYAHLSLHYFTNVVTKSIFLELHRVLKKDGLLLFMCKSTKDPKYGKGTRVEKDMFVIDGHVRHFFSPEYVRACTRGIFNTIELKEQKGDLYGEESAFVKVTAKKLT